MKLPKIDPAVLILMLTLGIIQGIHTYAHQQSEIDVHNYCHNLVRRGGVIDK